MDYKLSNEKEISIKFSSVRDSINLILEDIKIFRIDNIINDGGKDNEIQSHYENVKSILQKFNDSETALIRDFKEYKIIE